jgi:pimeloyl-ACP methyl ester carboxylesterase
MPTHQLKDGRILAYEIFGDPEGVPVIFSRGLSDSCLIHPFDDKFTKTLGIRLVSIDQPVVGGSTDVMSPEKRTLKNYAWDIEELVVDDALKLDKFAVAGHSGGGPHLLAIVAHMPDRVTRGLLAGPLAPLEDLPGISELFALPMYSILPFVMKWLPFFIRWLCVRIAWWWANRDIARYLKLVADPRQNKWQS